MAKEKLSVDRYLTLIRKPDVSLAVRQRHPRTLNDAVSATLEIEAFLSLGNQTSSHSASTVASMDGTTNATFASRDHKLCEMLQSLASRMDQMELAIARIDNHSINILRLREQERGRTNSTRHVPIICHKCGQPGHYTRGCANH